MNLDEVLKRIENAPRGARHNTLYEEAKTLFKGMSVEEVQSVGPKLVQAAVNNRIGRHRAIKTITAAFLRRDSPPTGRHPIDAAAKIE